MSLRLKIFKLAAALPVTVEVFAIKVDEMRRLIIQCVVIAPDALNTLISTRLLL